MRHPFKEFLYFSKGERRGILVLLVLIWVVFLVGHFRFCLKGWLGSGEARWEEQQVSIARRDSFLASVRKDGAERKAARPSYAERESREVVLAAFNPNEADSAALCRLGLPGWMARNVLRYREAGGKFRKAEDFRRIYGMTEERFQTLLPYISIPQERDADSVVQLYRPVSAGTVADTLQVAVIKYPEGTVIDLNRADTTELKKIPGIGSGIARLIVGYKQQLGGFYDVGQLQEIRLDAERLRPWFHIDTTDIRRINLNRAGVERLRNHPYINFYQAKAIVEYRRKNGSLRNLKPFVLYEEFSETDLERIGHYVCFE